MASIANDSNGARRLQFTDSSGIRRTIHLGKMTIRQAELLRGHVEKLIVASIARHSVEPDTARWVANLDDVLRGKLARVGLVETRGSTTLQAFIEEYIAGRKDAKETTKTVWRRTQRHLLAHFPGTRLLRDFTKSDAKNFRQYLIGEGLADNTVRRTCGVAKQFFQDALDRELVSSNPFRQKDIPTTTGSNQERQFYVTTEMAQLVLDSCPDAEWRLLFALSRFAGLRCPSEHLALRWSDVNWERSRMTVRSTKTEHHEGGASRIIPIFPELRPYLEAVFEHPSCSPEYVINRYRLPNTNLRTQLERIIVRAGLQQWPKLFHNLRASCETDLAARHPIHVVCEWIGNSIKIAAKHYLQTTDADFKEACGEKATQNPTQQPAVGPRSESQRNSSRKEKHWTPSVSPSRGVGNEGPASPHFSHGIRRFSGRRRTKRRTFCQ